MYRQAGGVQVYRLQDNVTAVTVVDPVDGRPRPRRRRPVPVDPPVASSSVHPAVLRAALALAGGDPARLRFLPDGSVMVANGRRA